MTEILKRNAATSWMWLVTRVTIHVRVCVSVRGRENVQIMCFVFEGSRANRGRGVTDHSLLIVRCLLAFVPRHIFLASWTPYGDVKELLQNL